jgi:LysM repeat protein
MDNDSKFIFEAYSKHLDEMAKYAVDKLKFKSDPRQGAGGGYGLKGLPDEKIDSLINSIETKLFKPVTHTSNGMEYKLFYPGSKDKFKVELINLIKDELKIGSTVAGYTARIVNNLLDVIDIDEHGNAVAQPKEVEKAVEDGAKSAPEAKPVKTETVYEIDKSVAIENKKLKALVFGLPDEDINEKEILGVLKNAIKEYNETPGLPKDQQLKIKSYDLIDILKQAGVLKEKQVEKQSAEGEGSGEVDTIEDYPETDDAGTVARELGMIGRDRGVDAGGFSFGD